MNDFDSFLHDFLECTNPGVMKRRIVDYAEYKKRFWDGDLIADENNTFRLKYFDPETGEEIESTIDYDKHLYSRAAYYFNNPTVRITNEIKDIAQLNKYLNMLRTAVVQIRKRKEFYDDYPFYVTAIIKLGNTLKEIMEVFDKPLKPKKNITNQLGEKTAKAVELKEYLTIIENAGDHEKAIEKIRERHPEFEYPNPRHKLFQFKDDKLIVKRACIALEEIGKLKWGDDAPKWETIKIVLF